MALLEVQIPSNPQTARIHRRPLPIRRPNTSALTLAALLIASALAPALSWAASPQFAHVRNFGKVDERLYRGGTPSSAALEELHAQGVKLVIDLREKGRDTERERQEVTALGMHYVSVPLSPWSAPTIAQVRTVLSLFGSQPAYVHCWRGKDRTGTMIACYRIQHDGWSSTRALEEANHYGMSHMERAMRSFIARFTASAVPALSPYVPAPPVPPAVHP